MKYNKIFMIVFFCLIIVQYSFAAERVFYEDCEDTNYSQHFLEEQFGTNYQSYWNELKSEISQSRTAHNGTYSATYNPFETGNPHARLGVGNTAYGNTSNFDLSDVDARYWYFRWYQRWEDGNNSGANKNLYVNSQPVGDYVFVIEKEGSVTFHILIKDHATYGLVVNTWANHSGGSLDDEEWHKMEVFIDSGTTGGSNGDYWVKIDDITLKSGSGYNFNSTIHSNPIANVGWPSNTSNASGSQQVWVDDLEVWIDGVPDGGGSYSSAPYTSGHSPPKGATGFYRDSNIIVHLQDSGDGVDQSSIVMTVNGQTVSPTITGTSSDYTLTYDPPNPLEGDVVVTLRAQDLDTPPNVMPQETYIFTVGELRRIN